MVCVCTHRSAGGEQSIDVSSLPGMDALNQPGVSHQTDSHSDHYYHDYHNMKHEVIRGYSMYSVLIHTLFSGKKTGDTKLINNNGKAEVYQVS